MIAPRASPFGPVGDEISEVVYEFDVDDLIAFADEAQFLAFVELARRYRRQAGGAPLT